MGGDATTTTKGKRDGGAGATFSLGARHFKNVGNYKHKTFSFFFFLKKNNTSAPLRNHTKAGEKMELPAAAHKVFLYYDGQVQLTPW